MQQNGPAKAKTSGLAQKVAWRKRQANTGSAGALARSEREARNSYGVKKFEIEGAAQACAGEGTRAPSIDLLRHSDDFLGKASKTGYLTAYCRLPSFLRLTACQILKVFNAGQFREVFQTELDEELF